MQRNRDMAKKGHGRILRRFPPDEEDHDQSKRDQRLGDAAGQSSWSGLQKKRARPALQKRHTGPRLLGHRVYMSRGLFQLPASRPSDQVL